jgi:hypothetical protein
MSLTINQKKEICDTFYYFTLLELAQKFNSSKSEISNVVTSYLIRNKKTSNTTQFRIEECVKAGYTINELMIKFRLKHKQARGFWLLYGTKNIISMYPSDPKEPYWINEDEMIIPSYSVKDLTGWEAAQLCQ